MSKYEIVKIEDIEISLDVSMFQKTDEIYFNATDISKFFGKDVREWFKNKETSEYLKEILNEYTFLTDGNSHQLEFGKYVRISYLLLFLENDRKRKNIWFS